MYSFRRLLYIFCVICILFIDVDNPSFHLDKIKGQKPSFAEKTRFLYTTDMYSFRQLLYIFCVICIVFIHVEVNVYSFRKLLYIT